MGLDSEIIQIALMQKGTVKEIRQGNDLAYLVRDQSGYAVAIPFDDERVLNEQFVGITLSTNTLNIGDKSFKVLYLYMIDTGDLGKFSYVASEFIDPANRANVLNNPYSWVDDWSEMFGNAKKKYMVTDVVAELAALKEVYKKDKSAKWMGPKDGTHDIVFDGGVVEVKSTKNKTDTRISINSQFQIDPSSNEKIYFVRLEPKPYAESIDSLVNDLITMGYLKEDLEESLTRMGYRAGSRTRKQTYDVLSINAYKVTEDNFPVISVEDINNLTKSKNVVGYRLSIDLAAIPSEVIK